MMLYSRQRRALITVFNAVIITLSLFAAYLMRFDFSIPPAEFGHLQRALWILLLAKLPVCRLANLDRGWLGYVSFTDLYSILLANFAGSVLFTALSVVIVGPNFPRSIYCIDFIICFLLMAAARCSVRLYHDATTRKTPASEGKGILIYGAGAAGAALLRDLRSNPALRYRVIGFLDDYPGKWNGMLMGVKVLGSGRDAARIVASHQRKRNRIEEIVIAMPSATGNRMREALANCQSAGVPCKTIPGVGELLSGQVLSSQIRNVSVLDLLGREPVHLDETLIRESIAGTTIMITGAGGSIGSELCRQVARFQPRRLIAFEQAETDLFRVHNELVHKFSSLEVVPEIGDIRDYARVEEVIRRHAVNSIFHAAAYKHVPMMESHVIEAVRNNILGTRNVVTAARRNGVSNFLMISSDKAVNPTNIMGATKRVAELIVSSILSGPEENKIKLSSVRFGNVLGSNGSVIPVFTEQIARGGPVTVTHPEMRRYFMTIPEAVQLVLQASTMGKGSEIFVLDMGEPIRIVDLARNMIKLSGREPDVDIEIRFTGLRPGEKLFEELITEGEDMQSTYHEKIKIFAGGRISRSVVEKWIRELEALIVRRDEAAVVQHLLEIVPQYKPSSQWRQGQASEVQTQAVSVA
jgi:FlaA1/EpsC-like NDP-sugar epimerase